jgi:hypothetical protein
MDTPTRRSGQLRRAALLALALSFGGVGAGYAGAFLPGGAPAWAAWCVLVGMAGAHVAVMVLGAQRHGRIGALGPVFAFVFLVLVVGLGAALVLPERLDAAGLWLGLPPRAAIVVYGVGLLPFLVLPLAYALTFERQSLSGEDLARLRELQKAAARAEPHEDVR